ELPTDWESEGFEPGELIIYFQNVSNILLDATILSINANVANVRINSIIASSGAPAVRVESSQYAFLQIQHNRPPAGVVVRDGEENAFTSALNSNTLFAAHPDRARVLSLSSTGVYTVPLPSWAAWPTSFPSFPRRVAQLVVGHFWPLQDSANLAATTPQALYPNRLFLLFGISESKFVRFALKTAQLNLYENNTPVPVGVALLGDNTSGWSASAAGSVATFVALHNRTAAHTSSANDVVELLQSQPAGTFAPIPPSPQAVGVGVFYSSTAGWGVRVSPPAPLATVSPLVIVRFATRHLPFTSKNELFVYPYDALTLRVSIDPSLQQILRVRCDIITLATNELIDSYTTDEARSLLHHHAHEAPP
ncbi:MAG: hypothetical protein D6750_09080, partial [Bacteroidetes bacterium]